MKRYLGYLTFGILVLFVNVGLGDSLDEHKARAIPFEKAEAKGPCQTVQLQRPSQPEVSMTKTPERPSFYKGREPRDR